MTRRLTGPYGWAQLATAHLPCEVASWFLHLPNQAPGHAWDSYLLGLVTLADVEGAPPPERRYPDAEYEILVVGLHPDAAPVPDNPATWHPMTPVEYAGQWHGTSTEDACAIAEGFALACVQGTLPACSSILHEGRMRTIQNIVDLWDAALASTVEHFRTGGLHGAHLN